MKFFTYIQICFLLCTTAVAPVTAQPSYEREESEREKEGRKDFYLIFFSKHEHAYSLSEFSRPDRLPGSHLYADESPQQKSTKSMGIKT